MRARPATLSLMSITLLGCTELPERPTEASPQDVEAITHLAADLDRIARAEDLNAFLTYVAEDCVLLAPDQPAVVGKDAIRDVYRALYDALDMDLTHHPGETLVYGDLLVHRGTATGTATPTGGTPMALDNKYLFVLLRQDDGSLKIWRAAYNSNTAPE